MHEKSMGAGLSSTARIDQPVCVCVNVPTNQTGHRSRRGGKKKRKEKKVLAATPNGFQTSEDGKSSS